MSMRKVGTVTCGTCGGSGKLGYGDAGSNAGVGCKVDCFNCEGHGYRIVVRNDEGHERYVTVGDYNSGNS